MVTLPRGWLVAFYAAFFLSGMLASLMFLCGVAHARSYGNLSAEVRAYELRGYHRPAGAHTAIYIPGQPDAVQVGWPDAAILPHPQNGAIIIHGKRQVYDPHEAVTPEATVPPFSAVYPVLAGRLIGSNQVVTVPTGVWASSDTSSGWWIDEGNLIEMLTSWQAGKGVNLFNIYGPLSSIMYVPGFIVDPYGECGVQVAPGPTTCQSATTINLSGVVYLNTNPAPGTNMSDLAESAFNAAVNTPQPKPATAVFYGKTSLKGYFDQSIANVSIDTVPNQVPVKFGLTAYCSTPRGVVTGEVTTQSQAITVAFNSGVPPDVGGPVQQFKQGYAVFEATSGAYPDRFWIFQAQQGGFMAGDSGSNCYAFDPDYSMYVGLGRILAGPWYDPFQYAAGAVIEAFHPNIYRVHANMRFGAPLQPLGSGQHVPPASSGGWKFVTG